jgi:hypothetical protein
LLRSHGAFLGLLCEFVHVLARYVVLVGDVFGGHAHRDVDVGDLGVVTEELRV